MPTLEVMRERYELGLAARMNLRALRLAFLGCGDVIDVIEAAVLALAPTLDDYAAAAGADRDADTSRPEIPGGWGDLYSAVVLFVEKYRGLDGWHTGGISVEDAIEALRVVRGKFDAADIHTPERGAPSVIDCSLCPSTTMTGGGRTLDSGWAMMADGAICPACIAELVRFGRDCGDIRDGRLTTTPRAADASDYVPGFGDRADFHPQNDHEIGPGWCLHEGVKRRTIPYTPPDGEG